MSTEGRWGLLLCLLAATPLDAAPAAAGSRPRIEGLEARREGERAVVSFRVADGLSAESLDWIDSGLPVTFRHRIEIVTKRGFPLMLDKVRAKVVVETTAQYDALTQRYSLRRHIEVKGRPKKLALPPDETAETQSPQEMRAWMTELSGIDVYDPEGPLQGEKLHVRVESSVGRRYLLLIFPARLTASAAAPLER